MAGQREKLQLLTKDMVKGVVEAVERVKRMRNDAVVRNRGKEVKEVEAMGGA